MTPNPKTLVCLPGINGPWIDPNIVVFVRYGFAADDDLIPRTVVVHTTINEILPVLIPVEGQSLEELKALTVQAINSAKVE